MIDYGSEPPIKPQIYSFEDEINGERVRIVYEIAEHDFGECLRDYAYYPQKLEWVEDVEELIFLHRNKGLIPSWMNRG